MGARDNKRSQDVTLERIAYALQTYSALESDEKRMAGLLDDAEDTLRATLRLLTNNARSVPARIRIFHSNMETLKAIAADLAQEHERQVAGGP
jgi:hypothetical protein